VRFLHPLVAAYRRYATPASDLSLCTAVALLTLASFAMLIDAFITPWNIGLGLLWISGFYFAITAHCLIRCRNQIAADDPAMAHDYEKEDWNLGKKPSAFSRFVFRSKTIRRQRRVQVRKWAEHSRVVSRGDGGDWDYREG
jgi:hypothetical protein